MADEAFGGPQQIIEADAEANLLNDLIRVLCVDIIFDGGDTLLAEVLWRDLYQVGDLGLFTPPSGPY